MDLKNGYKYTVQTENISAYLNDIKDYAIITPDEEHDIFQRIKDGDKDAREQVINCNQRLVFTVAKKYASNETQVLDLVGEGTMGLIRAIETYDPTKGFRFITYAIWWIRQFIQLYLMDKGQLVRQSKLHRTFSKMNRIKNLFFVKEGRQPTTEEAFDLFNQTFPDSRIYDERDAYDLIVESIDLTDVNNEPIIDSNYGYLQKTVSYNSILKDEENEYNRFDIKKKLNTLNKREKKILELSYGIGIEEPCSFDDIGIQLDLTGERVRQIKNEAIEKLRKKVGRF
jgi:RNA polymerase primary sigma factor